MLEDEAEQGDKGHHRREDDERDADHRHVAVAPPAPRALGGEMLLDEQDHAVKESQRLFVGSSSR